MEHFTDIVKSLQHKSETQKSKESKTNGKRTYNTTNTDKPAWLTALGLFFTRIYRQAFISQVSDPEDKRVWLAQWGFHIAKTGASEKLILEAASNCQAKYQFPPSLSEYLKELTSLNIYAVNAVEITKQLDKPGQAPKTEQESTISEAKKKQAMAEMAESLVPFRAKFLEIYGHSYEDVDRWVI